MTSFRRENIGYVFQFFNLLQDLTVLENILLIQELSGSKDQDRAIELLKLVGLEGEVNRFPEKLAVDNNSGWQLLEASLNDPICFLATN